ncbi:MAG: hypothetical protein ABIH34_07735 [Nanoarchaeota archaeon]
MDNRLIQTGFLLTLLIMLSSPVHAACDMVNYPYWNHSFPAEQESFEGVLFTYDVNATDPLDDTLTYELWKPDEWTMTLDSTTGITNFSPVDGDVGLHSIEYRVRNDQPCYNQSGVVSMWVRDRPNITSYQPSSFTPSFLENVSTLFNVTLLDQDAGDNMTFAWYLDSALNTTLAEYNYTAGMCDAGVHNISIIINDSYGLTTGLNWTVTIENDNRPPVLNGTIANQTVAENANLTNAFNVSDYFYDPDLDQCIGDENDYLFNLTFTASGNTSVTVIIGPAPVFNVSFYPPLHWAGLENITFIADDGYNTTLSNLMTLNVTNTPDAPNISQPQNLTIRKNTFVSFLINLADYDVNAPGDPMTFSANVSSPDVNLTKMNDSLANLSAFKNDTGSYVVAITATDSFSLSDTKIVHINFRENANPVIGETSLLANTTSRYVHQLNVSDADNDALIMNWTLTWGNLSNFYMGADGLINFSALENETGDKHINFTAFDGTNTTSKNITLTVVSINFPPGLNITHLIAYANQTFTYQLNITDPENDSVNVTANFINGSPSNFFMNLSGFINFTPLNNDSAVYVINFTANDSVNPTVHRVVNFTIYWINNPPNISVWNHSVTMLNGTEDSVLGFNISAYDPDLIYFDNLSVSFLVDGVNQTLGLGGQSFAGNTTTVAWAWSIDYCSAGIRNVTAIVSDSRNTTGQYSWNVSIANINRAPFYGLRNYNDTYFVNGTFNRTAVNDTSRSLRLTNTSNLSFQTDGHYTTPIIDLGDNEVNITNFTRAYTVPNGTAVYFKTRSSQNGITWGNWSEPYNTSYISFLSQPERFIQVWINMTTNDTNLTPSVYNFSLNVHISNKTIPQNTILDPWIDLDHYLFDLDFLQCTGNNKDNLTYTYTDLTSLVIIVDNNTHQARLEPGVTFWGEDSFTITVSDGINQSTTDWITVFVTQSTGTGGGSTGGGGSGGGGGGVRYVYKDVIRVQPVPKNVTIEKNITIPKVLDIISLSSIVLYENDTVEVPILLHNHFNESLFNISLFGFVNTSNITLSFLEDRFDELPSGTEVRTMMTLSSYAALGNYELDIFARVDRPNVTDTATLFINAIELGEKNTSQLNTRIAFTRDLLEVNPECLELNEMLGETLIFISEQRYADASETLNAVIDTCRYLISQRNKEFPRSSPGSFFKSVSGSFLNNLTLYLILIIFLATIAAMFLVSRRHMSPPGKKTRDKHVKKEDEEGFEPFH